MKNLWSWLGVAVLVVALGWGAYYGWQQQNIREQQRNELNGLNNLYNQLSNQNNSLQNQLGNSATNNGVSIPLTTTAGWKTYSNSAVGFSFKYPSDWKMVNLIKNIGTGWTSGIAYGNWDEKGPIYFDSDKIFLFSVFSKDYRYDLGGVNKKVDVNWSSAEFAANEPIMGTVLFTKKLSNRSMLVAIYSSPECSPNMRLSVYTPLTNDYPNLQITIDAKFYNDPTVKAYENTPMTDEKDPCDESSIYQKIANRVYLGTYSDKVNEYIETARLIADSVIVN